MGTTIKKIAYKSDIDRFIWRGQVQLTIERIFPDGSTIKIIRIRYIDEEIKSMKVEVKRITNDEKEENSFENQEIFTEEQIRSGDLSESKPFTL